MSSSNTKTAPALDHILLAVPYKTLQNPPPSLTKNFTIHRGGDHADSITTNALISFKSGTYLELIAFTPYADEHPELKKAVLGNSSRKPVGWIHWVLQPDREGKQIEAVSERVKAKGANLVERAGSRERTDGKKVEWRVNYPDPTVFSLGCIPFWCRDVSPREWRVEGDDAAITHPSGVVGVDAIRIVVAAEKYLETYAEAYAAVIGRQWKKVEGGAYEIVLEDPLEWPGDHRKPKVIVGLPRDEGEKSRMADEQALIAEVVFRSDGVEKAFTVEDEFEEEKITFSFR